MAFIHPLLYLVLQKLLIASLLAFTAPSSILRPALFPAILTGNIFLFSTYGLYIPRTAWIAFISGEILAGILDYLEKVLISQWNFEQDGPRIGNLGRSGSGSVFKDEKRSGNSVDNTIADLTAQKDSSIWKRLRFGAWVTISHRYIGTPYQARNTPPYSTSDTSYIPTKSAYLLRRGLVSLACYLITDILLFGSQPDLNPILFAQSKVPFFHRLLNHEITSRELFTRITTTIGFWVGAYFSIQGFYSATGFLSVAFGFSSPRDRRPIFGSLIDAYSVRRFWGMSWHQITRKKFTTIANYTTNSLIDSLRLPLNPKSTIHKYTELILVFLISGLLHQAVEVTQGPAWEESGAIQFFLTMAFGIMLEDSVKSLWKQVVQKSVQKDGTEVKEEVKQWQKAIGYLWVVLFFSWASPVWMYPTLRRNDGGLKSNPLPFSVVGLLVG